MHLSLTKVNGKMSFVCETLYIVTNKLKREAPVSYATLNFAGHKANSRGRGVIKAINDFIDHSPNDGIEFNALAERFPNLSKANLQRLLVRYSLYFKFDRATRWVTKAVPCSAFAS